MLMSDLETLFLEVSAHLSLKVATSDSFRGKNIFKNLGFLSLFKAKMEQCDKKIETSVENLTSLYFFQLNIFWK